MKADYNFYIRKVKDHPFIMIEDQDKGGRSVTNCIDDIISAVSKMKGINPVEHTIIYKDSEGNWDGYIFATKQFFPLRETHWLPAAMKYLKEIGWVY